LHNLIGDDPKLESVMQSNTDCLNFIGYPMSKPRETKESKLEPSHTNIQLASNSPALAQIPPLHMIRKNVGRSKWGGGGSLQ
jgi:hypothetical protein